LNAAVIGLAPGPNPTTSICNATGCLPRFENKTILFYFEKHSSLLQRTWCLHDAVVFVEVVHNEAADVEEGGRRRVQVELFEGNVLQRTQFSNQQTTIVRFKVELIVRFNVKLIVRFNVELIVCFNVELIVRFNVELIVHFNVKLIVRFNVELIVRFNVELIMSS
jgi:hypothetical protein